MQDELSRVKLLLLDVVLYSKDVQWMLMLAWMYSLHINCSVYALLW